MLLASMLLAAARRGSGSAVSFRSFAAASSPAGSSSKGGESSKKKKHQRRPSSPPPLSPPLPVVVLLGRPNVGKSALFNRLTGSRQALVRDTPGSHVTRDWRSSSAGKLGDLRFEVVDTSGLEEPTETRGGGGGGRSSSSSSSSSSSLEDGSGGLGSRAASLTVALLRSRADVALLLLDAKDGVTPVDESLARWLRRSGAVVVPDSAAGASSSSSSALSDPLSRPPPAAVVFVAVNKAEAARSDARVAAAVAEAGRLGFGEGVGVSAETGEGLSELYAALAPTLDKAAARLSLLQGEEMEEEEQQREGEEGEDERRGEGQESDSGGASATMRVALVGAPNAGKSTLSNALLGSERSLTGPEPGLTRDAVWATLEWIPPPPREDKKRCGEGGGEERVEGGGEEASPPSRSSLYPSSRIVELIDTAGWDRRTARTASIDRKNDNDSGDQAGGGGKGGGRETKGSTASSPSSSSSSSSSSSPASTLLAPADVIAEAMRQTERGINLAHVTVVVVDLAAAAARENPSSSASEGVEAAAVAAAAAAPRAGRKRRGDAGDGSAPQILSRTELALASRAAEAGRAVVFVGAKADLLLSPPASGNSSSLERRSPAVAAAARTLAADVSRRLPQLAGAPVLALSAVTGAGMSGLLPAVAAAHAAWTGRVPTSALNRWLEGVKGAGAGDAAARSLSRIRYLVQASSRPPSFVAFARGGTPRGGSSKAEAAKKKAAARAADERLEKMLSNKIKEQFGLCGVPIRVAVRGSVPTSGSGGGAGGRKKTDYRRRS